MFAPVAALASGGVVGLVLGLIGGGGSILAVPLLLYAVGMPSAHIAIGTAAVAVSINAAAGLALHARKAPIRWPCAIVFSLAGVGGVAGALAGTKANAVLARRKGALTTLFAVFVILAGLYVGGRGLIDLLQG